METKLYDRSVFAQPQDAIDFITTILQASTEYSMIGKDLEGTINLWNEGARRLYGYEPHEVVGKLTGNALHIPEDVASDMLGMIIKTALEEGKWEGVIERVRKDGSRFTARAVATPRRNTIGEPVGILLISKNITDEIRLQRDLQANQEKFKGLLESAPDAMVIVDRSGRMVVVNSQAETLFGYTRLELLGERVEVLVPKRYRSPHPSYRDGYFANPKVRPMGTGRELFGLRKVAPSFPSKSVSVHCKRKTASSSPAPSATSPTAKSRKRYCKRIRRSSRDFWSRRPMQWSSSIERVRSS